MINQENLIKIINFRKKMHEHPEVSNHEDNTRKLIKKKKIYTMKLDLEHQTLT